MFNLGFERLIWRLKTFTPLLFAQGDHDAHSNLAQPEDGAHSKGPDAGQSKDSDAGHGSRETFDIKKLAQDLLAVSWERRIEIAGIKFMESDRHDSGAKGEVVIATIVVDGGNVTSPESKPVAVKKLKFSGEPDSEKLLKAFVNELRVVDSLSHPHIVTMMGFVEDIEKGILWMVFPWETNGNVREFLRSGEWEIPERVSLIKDVAMGVEYLHTRQPPVRHGDLKSLNILVNDSCRAIITDFGSARIMRKEAPTNHETAPMNRTRSPSEPSWQIDLTVSDKELTLTGPSWSLRWAAPEILDEQEPDLASDIWALGWVCWEIMTDTYPFAETKGQGLITFKVIRGELPSMDYHNQLSQIRALCGIMLKCWKTEVEKRPSAMECCRSLQWMPSSIPVARVVGQSSIRSAALLFQLAQVHRIHDRNNEAAKLLEQSKAIAQATDDKPLLAKINISLGGIEHARGEYPEAEERFTHALKIYRLIGDDPGQADALNALGRVLHMWSKYAEAEGCYTQALRIYTSMGDGRGRAATLNMLGQINKEGSRYAEAEGHYTQALVISTSIGDDATRAETLRGLGDLRLSQWRYAEAEEYYTQALEAYTSVGDDLNRATVLGRLGNVHQKQSKYAEAEKHYTQALEINTNIGNGLGRANTLKALGHLQRAQKKYAEAEEHYTQAVEIYKGMGNQHGQANAYLGLGEIRLRQARYAEANALITDAAEIGEQVDYEWAKSRSKQLLSEILVAELTTSSSNLAPTTMEDFTTPLSLLWATDPLTRTAQS